MNKIEIIVTIDDERKFYIRGESDNLDIVAADPFTDPRKSVEPKLFPNPPVIDLNITGRIRKPALLADMETAKQEILHGTSIHSAGTGERPA